MTTRTRTEPWREPWRIDKQVNLGHIVSWSLLIMALIAGFREQSTRSAVTEYKVEQMDLRMQHLEDAARLNALTLQRVTTSLEERDKRVPR